MMDGVVNGGARPKDRTRMYFCKPCGHKHACPMNAKCPRQKQKKLAQRDENGDDSEEPSTSSATGGAAYQGETPRTRSVSKRKRQAILSDSDSDVAEPSPAKRRTSGVTDQVSLQAIMTRLESISDEGRKERARLAKESKADREYFRSALSALQQEASTDDECQASRARPGRTQTGDDALPGGTLPTGRDALAVLRRDTVSSKAANDVLQRCGPVQEDSNKRLWVQSYDQRQRDSGGTMATNERLSQCK